PDRHGKEEQRDEDATAPDSTLATGCERRSPGRHGAHSYTSRYLRTSRIEKMFRISVMTKSVAPTAKIVLYSTEPVGTSPAPVAAMKADIVSTAWRGSKERLGCWPAARRTIIVSPIAREMPRTKAATMPETAAGTTILVQTRSLLDPSGAAPTPECVRA